MDEKVIRATFDNETITIYQAYNKLIANAAVENQTLASPFFKQSRMTWIKPSFLWMMYRCGFATKLNQEHVLSIKIKRDGWQWALSHAAASSFNPLVHSNETAWKKSLQDAPVRIQWDPERDLFLNKLPYRSIQVGLSGIAVKKYINEWITEISDITILCKEIHHTLLQNKVEQATTMLPKEQIYYGENT